MNAPSKHKHCTFGSCKDPHYAKGFCSFHYERNLRGRPLGAPRRFRRCKKCDRIKAVNGACYACVTEGRKQHPSVSRDPLDVAVRRVERSLSLIVAGKEDEALEVLDELLGVG